MPDKNCYESNKEHHLELMRNYYINNREQILEHSRNKDNSLRKKEKYQRAIYAKIWYNNLPEDKKIYKKRVW